MAIGNGYGTNKTRVSHITGRFKQISSVVCKVAMLFNQSKCKCLHIGRANGKEPYEIHNTVLIKTSKEKDIGVTISADWKVSEQCGIAARKGNQLLGMIKRNITYYREKT